MSWCLRKPLKKWTMTSAFTWRIAASLARPCNEYAPPPWSGPPLECRTNAGRSCFCHQISGLVCGLKEILRPCFNVNATSSLERLLCAVQTWLHIPDAQREVGKVQTIELRAEILWMPTIRLAAAALPCHGQPHRACPLLLLEAVANMPARCGNTYPVFQGE